MYQIRTSYPLGLSKKYCSTREDLIKHLTFVVDKTNEYRNNLPLLDQIKKKWRDKLKQEDIENGLELVEINNNNSIIFDLFGNEKELSFDNLKKKKTHFD